MSKEEENKIVPRLRFPEFEQCGEWHEEILERISPSIFDGTHQTPKYIKDGIPFFSVENLISKSKNKFISRQDYLSATIKNKPEKEDILITRIGNIGFSKIVDWEYEFSIYVTLAVVKKSARFDSYYLHSFFQSDFYQKEIRSKSLLNAVPCKINMDELRRTKVLLPPDKEKKEQQKIADCLCSLDDLLTAENGKLEALKVHKKGLMQQLFPAEGETVPKLRFAEFRDSGEWEEKTIGDFVHSHKGGAPLTPSDFASYSTYEVVPKKAICEGMWLKLDTKNPTYCSEKFFKDNTNSVVDSEYLITTLRDLVPSGPNIGYIVKYAGTKKFILAQGVYGIKLKETIIPEFLIHFSNTTLYRKLVNAVMVGSTQVHIRNSVFFSLAINVPSLEEQQKIADCLSSLDELITEQAQKIEALTQHKKGLLQGLFPGAADT